VKGPEERDDKGAGEDLVRFFRALRPDARKEYEALAARDRELGEDVAAERRAQGGKARGS
jgi:hypothetical protein